MIIFKKTRDKKVVNKYYKQNYIYKINKNIKFYLLS